ncbi:MAG: M23 family metallopeptidase [Deltaproteobacteria bacterium]|nr:M23 family metallopeptidase [Deltaproteobacteria bacterium]MBI2540389.1 M23 family metallopeptidase [Deltaproteobacteria bacterium]
MGAAGLVLSVGFFLSVSSLAGGSEWSVVVTPAGVSQGGVVRIQVAGEEIQTMKGRLGHREIPFFGGRGVFSALIGVDLEESPGAAGLVLQGWSRSGESKERKVTLQVRKKKFPQEKLSVPASFDRIDEATKRRIDREQEQLNGLWTASSLERWWEGAFLAPVSGGVTSPFGLRRIVNGLPRSPHGGVDLKASLGAEVLAANHGRVALREEFFFSGKSIVLDHGGGLYTMYFHLDEFHAGKDAQVRKGDLIGRAGMTGRVTGPHLHWGVRLNGARVDPFELIAAVK